jgi:hypothetical protein
MDGPDHLLAAAVVADCLTDELDTCRQGGLADETVAPQFVEQFFFANDDPSMLHEVREYVEDLGLEFDLTAIAPEDDSAQVQLAAREAENHHATSRATTIASCASSCTAWRG